LFKAVLEGPLLPLGVNLQIIFCYGGRYGQEQFTGGLQGTDLLLFEDNLNPKVTQFPHRFQKLNRISGKPGYGFGVDHIKFPIPGIFQHSHEFRTLVGIAATDTPICVNPNQLITWIIFKFAAPILFLKLIAVKLCLAGRGHSDVGYHALSSHVIDLLSSF
jgi:hypothetical protein